MARTRRSQRRKNQKKKITIVVVIVVVLVILVVGGLFGYRIYDEYCERNGRNKLDEVVTVTVSETDTIEDVVYKLKDSGIIKYENKLSDYLDRQGDIVLNTGDIQINKYASYPDIFAAIRKVVSRQTVTIRFTEGDEVSDVIDAFVDNGIGTKEDFEQIINTYDFGYSYIPSVGTENRLEGFLYPDTYEFYQDTSPEKALQKLVDEFDTKISDSEIQAALENSDMSFYQVLTLASIVQKEAGSQADMPKVASVFLNRLDINMKLQSDACYSYKIPKEQRTYSLTYEQIATDDPYNTYFYEGLTPTPISNPTIAAIRAVLMPADTDYLYFCYVGDGVTKFAETFAQHQVHVAEYEDWYAEQKG